MFPKSVVGGQLSVVRGLWSVVMVLLFVILAVPFRIIAQDLNTAKKSEAPQPRLVVQDSLAVNKEVTHKLTIMVAASGRVFELTQKPGERISNALQLAPGVPPLLSFRYFEGKIRHRFGNLDLVLDDAAH
jgi:hypothetical protein